MATETKKAWATREKRDRADSATRAALLAAARTVFERRGYARTTVAGITAEAGVGRATFYVYFASKAEAFAVPPEPVRDRLLARRDLFGVGAGHPAPGARAALSAQPHPTL